MKTLILNKVMCYFNTKSELYIPNSLYEHTKTSKKGIFEAINYFDLECYMKMFKIYRLFSFSCSFLGILTKTSKNTF